MSSIGLCTSPEDWIDVAIREPESERGYFQARHHAGSRRCQPGSPTSVRGLNTHCTPLVAKSVMDCRPSAGSHRGAGFNPLIKEVEETTAKYVGKGGCRRRWHGLRDKLHGHPGDLR